MVSIKARSSLIRLASSLEKGSKERRAILFGLQRQGLTKSAGNTRSVVVREAQNGEGLAVTFREYLPKGQVALPTVAYYGDKFAQDTKSAARSVAGVVPTLGYPENRSGVWVEGDGRNLLLRGFYYFEFSDDEDRPVTLFITLLKSALAKKGWKAA